MPIRHGRTTRTIRANIPKNIASEMHSGKPMKQAVAVAMQTARTDARKAHVKPPSSSTRKR